MKRGRGEGRDSSPLISHIRRIGVWFSPQCSYSQLSLLSSRLLPLLPYVEEERRYDPLPLPSPLPPSSLLPFRIMHLKQEHQ